MKNILILDDNREMLEALSSTLGSRLPGCTILTAPDGEAGRKILESMHVDLILTDLAMPNMNGYMLIEHAKKNFPHIPVCVMSANCSGQVVNRLRAMGVGRWIEKPFQLDMPARMIAQELHLPYND